MTEDFYKLQAQKDAIVRSQLARGVDLEKLSVAELNRLQGVIMAIITEKLSRGDVPEPLIEIRLKQKP